MNSMTPQIPDSERLRRLFEILGVTLNEELCLTALNMDIGVLSGEGYKRIAIPGDAAATLIVVTHGFHAGETGDKITRRRRCMDDANLVRVFDNNKLLDLVIRPMSNRTGRFQGIKPKATCIEALIGAAYLTGGVELAETVMVNLGIIQSA